MSVVINGTTGISGIDGTATAPAVQGNDTNTGIFFPANDTIAFAEGGTEVMRIDSNGRVGIGTTTPGVAVDIVDNANSLANGQLRLSSSGNFGTRITFNSTSANGRTWQIGSNFVDGFGEFSIYDVNSASQRMRIDSSGRVTMPSQPAFIARSAGGTTTVTAGNLFPFSSATLNIGSHYNTSTYLFTAPVTGKYYFNASMYIQGASSICFKSNGVEVGTVSPLMYVPSGDQFDQSGAISIVAYLSAGDTMGVASRSLQQSVVFISHCSFSGFLIG